MNFKEHKWTQQDKLGNQIISDLWTKGNMGGNSCSWMSVITEEITTFKINYQRNTYYTKTFFNLQIIKIQ
jgi:hypothetical protein